jgi:hypothetical protein
MTMEIRDDRLQGVLHIADLQAVTEPRKQVCEVSLPLASPTPVSGSLSWR